MGGDTISLPASSIDDEDAMTKQLADHLSKKPNSWPGDLSGKTEEDNSESIFGEVDGRGFTDSFKCYEIEANERTTRNVYAQVLKNYDDLNYRVVNMEVAKRKILSYTPGSWVENVGGTTMRDYNVPKTTTLLLIGPKGSGKSSLVNRISRVFEDDKFAPERAQVTYNSRIANGTLFLHEYMIPRSSTSFCLYDTRSFSSDSSENLEMIKRWMTEGVSHGELVKSSSLQARMKRKRHQNKPVHYERRTVNFVIFVVNALSVLECVECDGADTRYTEMVAELFSSPFLSFKDHKPAIAITHGDLLSLSERARVRVYLGELLGVHPSKQMFDVPDNCEQTTDWTIVDMVRYALEHADRNLPCNGVRVTFKDCIRLWTCLLLLLAVGILIITICLNGFHLIAPGESIRTKAPGGSIPTKAPGVSIPTKATKAPGESIPTKAPGGSIPTKATKAPGGSIPTKAPKSIPTKATKAPGGSIPTKATKAPGGSIPTKAPGKSIPTKATKAPGGSIPTKAPGESIPTKATKAPGGSIPTKAPGRSIPTKATKAPGRSIPTKAMKAPGKSIPTKAPCESIPFSIPEWKTIRHLWY